MAATATPYGLRPVGLLGGRVYNQAMRLIPIATTYGTLIGMGDVVKIAAGTINKDTGTTSATPVGIFMGCYYTDPNSKQPSYHQSWPASTAATDAVAYVVDDPDVVFQIQADGAVLFDDIGNNAALIQGTVSANGLSTVALQASSINTTNTLPIRIIDWINPGTGVTAAAALTDAFPEVLCIWNWGMHQYRQATGYGN